EDGIRDDLVTGVQTCALPILGLRALWLVVAYWLCGAAAAAPWIANVDSQGLPALSRGGGPALTSGFGFWGANWAWAEQETKLRGSRERRVGKEGRCRGGSCEW